MHIIFECEWSMRTKAYRFISYKYNKLFDKILTKKLHMHSFESLFCIYVYLFLEYK